MSSAPDDDDFSDNGDDKIEKESPSLTTEQTAQIKALQDAQQAKFAEIVTAVAAEYGYDLANLSQSERDRLVDDAEEATVRWFQDVELTPDPLRPKTDLQKLLDEYVEIGQQILDIFDDAISEEEGDPEDV